MTTDKKDQDQQAPLPSPQKSETVVPPTADPDELTDDQLSKVSGGAKKRAPATPSAPAPMM